MLELREAGPDDHADVQHLHAQHTGQNYLSVRNYESWPGKCTLAVDGGEVLGFCLGNHDSGVWGNVVVTPDPLEHWNCSYITHLVVDAGYRRHGIGSILLRDFLEQAERAGNTWVILTPARRPKGRPRRTCTPSTAPTGSATCGTGPMTGTRRGGRSITTCSDTRSARTTGMRSPCSTAPSPGNHPTRRNRSRQLIGTTEPESSRSTSTDWAPTPTDFRPPRAQQKVGAGASEEPGSSHRRCLSLA